MLIKKSLLSMAVATAVLTPSVNTLAAPSSLTHPVSNESQLAKTNAWLEVNVAQFNKNIDQFKSHLSEKTRFCAVMKADAYGNGIEGLMPAILAQNIPCVAIASNIEAETVRNSGFTGQLMRVRAASLSEVESGLHLDIEEMIGSEEQAKALSELALKQGRDIKVHLALNDGGMGRNGLDMSNKSGETAAVRLTKQKGVSIVGIMTHFPSYDADDIRAKLVTFDQHVSWLIKNSDVKRKDVLLHVANSYTALNVPEAQLDMVRPGGVLYGDLPTNPEYPSIVSFKTRVASLHALPKGSTVGYESTFVTKKDSVLANIPVGYSDGYPRKMGNKSEVLINGQRAKVIGVTSMNTMMVDVSDIKGVLPGDEVTLFGSQDKQSISISEMENHAELIFPELYTIWGNSNPRFYIN